MYKTKPLRLISHCIGHEGPGSLLSLLKAKGWATELGAGTGTQSTHFSIFEISVKLLEQGLPNYQEIIKLVFQYLIIHFRGSEHSERYRIRDEMAHIEELNFRYRSKVREDQYTEQLAVNLTRYDPEDCICGPDLFFEKYDMSTVDDLIDTYFQPSNMRVHLIAPEAEQPDIPPGAKWEEEFWYKTRYFATKVDEKVAEGWVDKKQACDEGLHLPPANPYTPGSCEMKKSEAEVDHKSAAPTLILDTPTLKLWHLLDTSFKQPKASCHIQLTNFVVEQNARMAICLRMLLEVLHEITNEEAYEAEESGLIFDVTNTSASSQCCGLRLTFKGYNDKLAILVKNIMAKLAQFNVEEHSSKFDLAKEETILDYRNRRFQQNYVHGIIAMNQALEHPFWSNEQRLEQIETVTMAEVQDFVKLFLSEMLVEAVVVGNMDKDEAEAMMTCCTGLFTWGPLCSANVPRLDITRLEEGVTVLREQLTPDPGAVDSTVVNYLQIGPRNTKDDSLLELLTQVMDKEMYAQLRTVEQLGYIVSCAQVFKWNVAGLRLLVQGVKSPSFLEVRIETFLTNFTKYLEEISEEDLKEHIDSLITKKREQDRSSERRCERFMTEVCSHRYVFDRRFKVIDYLESVTKADLIDFFNKHVSPSSSTRKKLTCHVVGKHALDAQAAAGEEPDVTPESASNVLIFPKGAVPFPIDGSANLPEPNVMSLVSFREGVQRYSEQK